MVALFSFLWSGAWQAYSAQSLDERVSAAWNVGPHHPVAAAVPVGVESPVQGALQSKNQGIFTALCWDGKSLYIAAATMEMESMPVRTHCS